MMRLPQLQISGDIHHNSDMLKRFAKDASSYMMTPKIVANPKTEDDIIRLLQFARDEGLSITCRAGGSGLSGAAVGDGIIIGTLITEFDESPEQAIQGKEILEDYNISRIWEIGVGSDDEEALWEDRRRILPSLWKYVRTRKWILPSIIDDIAIHLKDFGNIQYIEKI